MRGGSSIASFALLVLLVVLPFGCTVTTAPVPTAVILATETTGTLVVSWTIERRADRDACDGAAVTAVRIHLVTAAGTDAGTYEQDCRAFSTTVRLDAATYAGSAILLDALGGARTSTMTLRSFTVLGGDVITTRIDFAIETFAPN
jgi:hypothetical protein